MIASPGVADDDLDSTLAADTNPAVIGGRYELLGLLGSGGMGNVYKVRDTELDEVVALKVLRPEVVAGTGALDRFRREVKLARRVTHPNVARVFDIGEAGRDRLLTMEYVDGESLGALVRREGRLPLARACTIARAICEGLAAAHAAGVIHRDVKPENVLIARDGRVVVTDFGIARAASDEGRTVGFVGTPAYMAPEQIDERSTIDHRADVYAFGVLLFELLTGETPWKGESVWALAAARLLEQPPDPRSVRPELPEALAELVLGCLARAVDERTASIAEVAAALAEVTLPEAGPSQLGRAPQRGAAPRATTGVDKRVAVLPFANLGPAEQDYVADGLTDDLIDGLSVAPGLRVRSRGVVMRFKGAEVDPRDLGRELDVEVVVEGSVRRTPAGYRISTRLISVADGFQVWARRFDVTEAELLIEIDAIARAIATALTVVVDIPARPEADSRAVDLYLRARDAYRRCFAGDRRAPLELYSQLLELTPDDARALAGRAMAGAAQYFWTAAEREVALAAALRAVELAPNLAEGHYALAIVRVMEGDTQAAVAPLRRALRLQPTSAEARHLLGALALMADQLDVARAELEAAIASEPGFEFSYLQLGCCYEYYGERERVDELFALSRSLGLGVHFALESTLCMWRRDRARGAELLEQIDPSHPIEATTQPWLELLVHGTPPPRGLPPVPPGASLPKINAWFYLQTDVEIACLLGDVDDAVRCLARYLDAGGTELSWARRVPLLEPLRTAPGAQPLLAELERRAVALGAVLDATIA